MYLGSFSDINGCVFHPPITERLLIISLLLAQLFLLNTHDTVFFVVFNVLCLILDLADRLGAGGTIIFTDLRVPVLGEAQHRPGPAKVTGARSVVPLLADSTAAWFAALRRAEIVTLLSRQEKADTAQQPTGLARHRPAPNYRYPRPPLLRQAGEGAGGAGERGKTVAAEVVPAAAACAGRGGGAGGGAERSEGAALAAARLAQPGLGRGDAQRIGHAIGATIKLGGGAWRGEGRGGREGGDRGAVRLLGQAR